MRIAYVLYPEAIVINGVNGIRNQAIKWADSLKDLCQIDLISTWGTLDWCDYDIIHFFGGSQWLGFVPDLKRINPNVIFSPVLDSVDSMKKIKMLANFSVKGYHHAQNFYKQNVSNFEFIFVRSQYEGNYFSYCYGIPQERIIYVPIAFELNPSNFENKDVEKENICLHISALYQERKNVIRLIEAAKKYHFPLVLAGSTGNNEQKQHIFNAIGKCNWIEVLGYISDEEALRLYRRAKVFALPSINEGVGIVALNAAVAGCNIVITNVGGPQEYYGGMATLVNPYDINEIGRGIQKALEIPVSPQLKDLIIKNYSCDAVAQRLINCYESILKK